MIQAVENYMSNHGITMTDVSKNSGISMSTLSQAFQKPVESWSIRILNALALVTYSDPGYVLDEIQERTFKYVVDREKQTIQGYYIPDPHDFWRIEAAVHNTVMEGYQPTKQDIAEIYARSLQPRPELDKDYQEIFEGKNEWWWIK